MLASSSWSLDSDCKLAFVRFVGSFMVVLGWVLSDYNHSAFLADLTSFGQGYAVDAARTPDLEVLVVTKDDTQFVL